MKIFIVYSYFLLLIEKPSFNNYYLPLINLTNAIENYLRLMKYLPSMNIING